jgi:hypothetical protein
MSIFKDTLKKDVYDQIKAREKVISGENNHRDPLLPWYLSKNAWVRMTSFVDYSDGPVSFPGYGQVEIDEDKGNYKGDQLSKKYILQGGTLYTKQSGGKTLSQLRAGITGEGSAYGSDIDFANGTQTEWFRTYGIRPMPGITGVEMKTINAYGSVYESTVKFYVWDTHQLNELEILFMRPGYSVLLEWGWSQYIDNNGRSQVFNGGGINPFAAGLTQQKVYDQLEGLRKKHNYNYDGMLGYIKNFNWTLLPNGGFECTTTLISIGEVMSSLRIAPSSTLFEKDKNSTITADISGNKQPYYDDYETILLSLKYQAEGYRSPSSEKYTINETRFRGKFTRENFVPIGEIADKLVASGYPKEAEALRQEPYIKPLFSTEEQGLGMRYEYIQLNNWIAIMDSYFSYKFQNSDAAASKLVRFFPPGQEDYCLAGKDSISCDLSVCAVNNPLAFPEFSNVEPDYYDSSGIDPKLSQNKNSLQITAPQPVITLPAFYDNIQKVGIIGNIWVNIDLLYNTYSQMRESANGDGVILTDYVKNILGKISGALGGINDFQLSTATRDQNTLKIIDNFYLEKKSGTAGKYQLNLSGLNTIFKEVKIQSKIFPEQSTIIAIAAQNRANLGNVYNSTQVYLNAGLKDRLAPEKGQGEELNNPEENQVDPTYQKLLNFLIYLRDGVVGTSQGDEGWKIDPSLASSDGFLKSFLIKYDGDLGFKALIPFTLTVTLEGLGGFVIGEIFRVDQNILPKNYYDKKLGFIITRIFHSLNNSSWETKLETQICILDQDQFYDESGIAKLTKNLKREGFQKWVNEAKIDAILYPIFYDFIRYLFYKSLVGGIYASFERENLTPDGSVENIIENYVFDNDSDPLNKTWGGSNVHEFLSSGTEYTKKDFIRFTYDWISKYENQHATDGRLDVQFTEDYTVRQALEQIKKPTFSGIVVDTFTETYRTLLQNMEFLFLNSIEGDEVEKLFWWNGALFQNPGALYQAVTRQVEGTIQSGIVTGTRIENEGYVLNENIVKNNIDNVISSKFSSLISNYNALNTTSGAKVNTLFAPEETTLYPKLNLRDANSISRFATKITWNPNFITLGDLPYNNINNFRIPITG